mgnify:CR=1 FL=1
MKLIQKRKKREGKAEKYIQTAFENEKIDLTKEKCIHGYGAIN